jgi:2-methylaconitate cis-trans-isomerase PrpF
LLGVATDGLTPVPAIVSPPAPYTSYGSGDRVATGDIDLVARVVGGRPAVLHKAYPGTLGACTGAAACIPGTSVHDVSTQKREGEIRIGHTSGVMTVQARISRDNDVWRVEQAAYNRTARRLAEGTAFIRRSTIPEVSTG